MAKKKQNGKKKNPNVFGASTRNSAMGIPEVESIGGGPGSIEASAQDVGSMQRGWARNQRTLHQGVVAPGKDLYGSSNPQMPGFHASPARSERHNKLRAQQAKEWKNDRHLKDLRRPTGEGTSADVSQSREFQKGITDSRGALKRIQRHSRDYFAREKAGKQDVETRMGNYFGRNERMDPADPRRPQNRKKPKTTPAKITPPVVYYATRRGEKRDV